MTKSNIHKLETLAQIALFSEDEFARMLPDLMAWFAFSKQAQKVGAITTGFTWIDDANPGSISSVVITDPITGQTMEIGADT